MLIKREESREEEARNLFLSFDIACSDFHSTKYSGGHYIFAKMIKNSGKELSGKK